jgi:hypothetical protein
MKESTLTGIDFAAALCLWLGGYYQRHGSLSEKLSTSLQFECYLTRALEEAYKVGQKPVGADMIENVLAKDINGLEKADPAGLQREGLGTSTFLRSKA